MAFVSNMEDEEKTDPNITPQGPISPTGGGTTPVRLSPSSAVPSGGGVSGAAGATPTPGAGGQFASIGQYLSANQGQAAPLAAKITPSINKQYQNLDTASNAAISDINKQVAAGAAPNNADAIIAQESANPASFTNTPSNVTSFQGLLNASYGGPASAEGTNTYQAQQNAINQAIATGQAQTGTEAGRENLIQQNEITPTAGTTALNEAILSQDPNALASIQEAYKPFGNLLTNLQSGASATDQQIAQNQARAAQDQQAAQQAITSQINALNTGVTGELTAAQQQAAAQNANIKAALSGGTPSPSQLQALGITPAQWSDLSAADKAAATAQTVQSNRGQFGATTGTTTIDPTQFLTQQDPNAVISAANIATPEDYAKAQAFQTLLQGMNFQAPTAIINPATASQAGTAPTNLNKFDYQTALNTATAAKQDEVAAAQAYVDALQSGADEQHAQMAAQQAGRQRKEQMAESASMIGLPIAIASNLPVIGAPISNAVDTVVQAVSNPSWICTAMRKAGILTQKEIDKLHAHLFVMLPHKPWPFCKYFILGQPLVILANIAKIDWSLWKPKFYTHVLAEKNRIKAVELYEKYFWMLAKNVCQKLWKRIFIHD